MRFLTFDDTHYPKNAAAQRIPFGMRVVNPTFAFRWSCYGESSRYPEFAARPRVNTVSDNPKLGGRTGYRLVSHNVACLVPPASNGKVVEMTHKPTGRNVVRAPRAFNRFRHEEWVRQGDGPTAENIIAFDAPAEQQRVRLTLTTKDGAQLQRSIALVGDAVRFETTMTADAPRMFDILVHPEYDTATMSIDPVVLGFYVKQTDWTQANRKWKEVMSTDQQRAIVKDAVGGGAGKGTAGRIRLRSALSQGSTPSTTVEQS